MSTKYCYIIIKITGAGSPLATSRNIFSSTYSMILTCLQGQGYHNFHQGVLLLSTLSSRFYFRSISFPQFELRHLFVYFPPPALQYSDIQRGGFLTCTPSADSPVLQWILFSFNFIFNGLYKTLFILKAF